MAAATMANNALAVIFTVLFARLLGADDYGSLAALVSTFVILAVPGSALQVAVAREVALGRDERGRDPGRVANTPAVRRLRGHRRRGAAATADLRPDRRRPEAWAAAATAPTGGALAPALAWSVAPSRACTPTSRSRGRSSSRPSGGWCSG